MRAARAQRGDDASGGQSAADRADDRMLAKDVEASRVSAHRLSSSSQRRHTLARARATMKDRALAVPGRSTVLFYGESPPRAAACYLES